MELWFLARIMENNDLDIGLFQLVQDNKMYCTRIFRIHGKPGSLSGSLSKGDILRLIKYDTKSNLVYCINDIICYQSNTTRLFAFKPEYFDQIMTTEKAYEHLLHKQI